MAAADGVEGLALDLDELKHLQSVAKRPRVLSLISSEIQKLEKLSRDARSISPVPTPISTEPKVISNPAPSYPTSPSFSWDQDDDKVKIYVSLEGVDQEKMETDFKPMSIDVKFHDVQGKNYRFSLSELSGEIVPEKCEVMVEPTRVTLTLPKASKGNWLDLYYKDPMAGIVDMMKNMYYEGDEETKRTIAKAWKDSQIWQFR